MPKLGLIHTINFKEMRNQLLHKVCYSVIFSVYISFALKAQTLTVKGNDFINVAPGETISTVGGFKFVGISGKAKISFANGTSPSDVSPNSNRTLVSNPEAFYQLRNVGNNQTANFYLDVTVSSAIAAADLSIYNKNDLDNYQVNVNQIAHAGYTDIPVEWTITKSGAKASDLNDLTFTWGAALETSTIANKALYVYDITLGVWTKLPKTNITVNEGQKSLTYTAFTGVLNGTKFMIAALDSDGDAVSDSQEALDETDPNDATKYKDSDGDGVSDYQEILDKTDSNDPSSFKDSDGGGTPDYVEEKLWPALGLEEGNIADKTDDRRDTDGDGVSDYQELLDGTDPKDNTDFNDTDGDGISDSQEALDKTDPNDATNYKDSDGDGVPDYQEQLDKTNPNDLSSFKDSDGGGVPDYVEEELWPALGLEEGDITDKSDDSQDTDGDGVPDYQELLDDTDPKDNKDYKDSDGDGVPDYQEQLDKTNPNDPSSFKDSDGGGVPDYVEEELWPALGLEEGDITDKSDDSQDTDGDGVPDYQELLDGTDPKDNKDYKDSDGDGVPNYQEQLDKTNPNDPSSFKDSDGGGVPDYVEEELWPALGLEEGDITDKSDDSQDTDGDGVPDYQELLDGTDPKDNKDYKDSDGDGVPNYREQLDKTNPNDPSSFKDSDGGGVPDYVEEELWPALGLEEGDITDKSDDSQDTDGDGVPDYQELLDGTDPKDNKDYKDSDGDGVPNYREQLDKTNPNDPSSFKDSDGGGVPDYVEEELWPALGLEEGDITDKSDDSQDTDGDGVPDYQELLDDTDPKDNKDYKDSDGDGVPNYREQLDKTNPNDPSSFKDSDGGGVPDYVEEELWPALGLEEGDITDKSDDSQDTDGDGVPDYQELLDDTDPKDNKDYKDSDGDGVPDYQEQLDKTNPNDPSSFKDSDGGGVPDYVEEELWPALGLEEGDITDKSDDSQDTDGDGVSDYQELLDGTDPKDNKDYKDSDGDGVPNYREQLDKTNPNDPSSFKDSDGGGVPDYVEEELWPALGLEEGDITDKSDDSQDTDGDGVSDYQELLDGTDPKDNKDYKDSDGDGVPNYREQLDKTNPNDPSSFKDSDGGGVPDYVEEELWPALGLEEGDITDKSDDSQDTDGDGVPDYQELLDGTDPKDNKDYKDSDGDGVSDDQEKKDGTDLKDNKDYKDSDGDSVPDYKEQLDKTNPNDASDFKDIDGDGVPDYIERQQGTDPNNTTDFKDSDGDGLSDYYEAKNVAPSNIMLSMTAIAENSAVASTLAQLSSIDTLDTYAHSYSLVSGSGDTDNAKFEIVGKELKVKELFDFEKKSSYSVRIRTTDAGFLSYEKAFTITIKDVNEAPTKLALSKQNIYEGNNIDDLLGLLSSTDEDAGDSHSYTLVSGTGSTDNASFKIVNGQFRVAQSFKYATKNSYSVRIRTTDKGGLSTEQQFSISISEKPVITGTGNETFPFTRTAASTNPSISLGYTSQLYVNGPDIVSYNWTTSTGLSVISISNPEAKPKVTTTYSVEVTNRFGSKTTVSITVTVRQDYNIIPNNLITPNGDGENDVWVIENLESYPNNKVSIFDRAGRLIYGKTNYNNDWNGQLNGYPLAEDTYYYIILLDGGKGEKKGFISIVY
jgi:gliding motility-associated-like protein